MSPRARRTNGCIASLFVLVLLLVQCNRSDRDSKGSLASSSAAASALPRGSSSAAALPEPSSSAPSPPLAVNRAPTGEGDEFLIEVPKLAVDSPPELRAASTTLRECPLELAKADTSRERLERLAKSGDPCAKSALVSKLLAGRPSHDAFRRALRLAIEAQSAGATVRECFLFDFAGEGAWLGLCAARTGQNLLSSLLHVSGYGVPRDLELAATLLEKDESRACSYDQIKAIIAAERAHPTERRYAFCREAACTSLEWHECYKERNYRYEWKSSELRAKLAEAASPQKKEFERLLALFDGLVQHDSMHVYWGADGPFSNARALGQELVLRQRFDALLEKLLVEKKLPDADDAAIAALQKQLHELDRLFLKRKPSSEHRAAERYVVEYFSAQKAYQTLEQGFVPFATSVLGQDRGLAARAALLRLRVETLEAASQP